MLRRIVSKSCAAIRMLNCLPFFIFPPFVKVGVGFCPQTAFGREPGHRRLAKCDAGSFVGTSSISLAPPQAAGLVHSAAPPLKIAIALLDCDFVFCARWHNVGFYADTAHTLAVGVESRTQRRHAPHGAARTFGTPTGSIVPIFFTGGKSALSARLREIHRLPLLRYVSAKIPFSPRAATLSRTRRVTFFGVIPSVPSGSIFSDSADGEPRYLESARSNSERSFVS